MNFQSIRLTQRPLARGGHVTTLTLTAKMGSMGPAFWQEVQGVLQKWVSGVRAA